METFRTDPTKRASKLVLFYVICRFSTVPRTWPLTLTERVTVVPRQRPTFVVH